MSAHSLQAAFLVVVAATQPVLKSVTRTVQYPVSPVAMIRTVLTTAFQLAAVFWAAGLLTALVRTVVRAAQVV